MHVLACAFLAAMAFVFAASKYEYRGYEWADNTCSSVQSLCDSPETVLGLGIATVLAYFLWGLHNVKF